MGGKVLDLPEFKIFDEGKVEGKILARFEDGMSIEEIASKSNVTVDHVKTVLRNNGLLE